MAVANPTAQTSPLPIAYWTASMARMNLESEVAERPKELIVYGGSGKAARNWECFEAIVATLKRHARL